MQRRIESGSVRQRGRQTSPTVSLWYGCKICSRSGPKSARVEELREVIVMEQFLNALRPDVRLWVKERKPETVGELADQYAQARKQTQDWNKTERSTPEQLPTRPKTCHNCGQVGHFRKDCMKTTGAGTQETTRGEVLQLWQERAHSNEVPQ